MIREGKRGILSATFMSKDYQAIIREIIGHITKKCLFDDISEFFVGITSDTDIRLFDEHNVNKEYGC